MPGKTPDPEKNYNLPAYIDAFGDEVRVQKAFQALMVSMITHLDMGGRRFSCKSP